MNEDYVSYIAAQTLKQIGFNEPCKGVYMHGQCMLLDSYSYNKLFEATDTCSAPTIAVALKWLRNNYNIFVEITTFADGYTYTIKQFSVENGWVTRTDMKNVYESYEDAVCDGLITGLKYSYYDGKEN